MERIDHNTNRLPRGRTYANRGSVLSVELARESVSAKVQGSRRTPYRVEIRLAPLNKPALEALHQTIAAMPAVATQLSLGKMPDALLAGLQEKGVDLFPLSWKDIQANCSCPDWANPCKHLAAVYYILANEIDKNPFLLFQLRGVDKNELVQESGIALDNAIEPLPQETFLPAKEAPLWDVPSKLEPPNLNLPAGEGTRLFGLLPDNALFYPAGNFKRVLLAIQSSAGRAAEAVDVADEGETDFSEIDFHLTYPDSASGDPLVFASPAQLLDQLPVGENITLMLPPTKLGGRAVKTPGRRWPLAETVRMFMEQPLDTALEVHSPTSRFLNAAASVALAFVRAGAFIPALAPFEAGRFGIRYAALARNEQTQQALAFLSALLPPKMGFQSGGKSLLARDSLPVLFDRILTAVIHIMLESARTTLPDDELTRAFIRGEIYQPRRFEDQQTGTALCNWLACLSLHVGSMVPVLHFETCAGMEEFDLNIQAEDRRDAFAAPRSLAAIFDEVDTVFGRPAREAQAELLRALALAGDYLPKISEVVNSRGKQSALVKLEEMGQFLQGRLELLNLLGIRVRLPKGLAKLARPVLTLKASAKGRVDDVSYLSLAEMLQFSYELALGDEPISAKEFRQLLKSAGNLVRYRDQFVMLDAGEAQTILRRLQDGPSSLSGMERLRVMLAGERDGIRIDLDETLRRILDHLAQPGDIPLPAGVRATLRPYQERGFRWLHTNIDRGLGCCLADDMGLGKTLQVLTLLQKRKEDGTLPHPALIVCPTTLVGNWRKECEKFTPGLNVAVYHGAQRQLAVKGKDMVITTYGLVRRDAAKFKSKEWSLVILDEAQAIKNPEADQSKAVKGLKAGAGIAMTGTPVENRLSELWSIFDFLGKGYLGSLAGFKRDFATPIEKYRDPAKAESLRRVIAPFLLRRMKTDKTIIQDLPEKIITDDYCNLTREQAALYESEVKNALRIIQDSEGIARRGLIFQMITRLKQICNHPVQYAKKGRADKSASGKAERAVELLAAILQAHEKALIFTQYREMGELLVEMIRAELRHTPAFFHGGVSRTQRDRMVDEFQENAAHKIMIVSLKAGGTGLNLTAANHVIHYDLWWNPAVENQATDRVFRIGQQKNVMVNRLITLGTFEEKIDAMIKAKQELTDLTVSAGEHWITELSDRELREIFALGAGEPV